MSATRSTARLCPRRARRPNPHERPRLAHATRAAPSFEEPENPLHHLTPEQIEQLGRELDAIHEEVFADLGERDARYIRSTIALHRQLALGGRALLMRLAQQAAVAGGHRSAVAREDPREHGDRPQRDARAVGLDERPRHQLPELGLGHRLAGRGVAALTQLRAPHVHEHPRQGPRPRLRDHADRPAPALAPGLPAAAALQPAPDGLLRVGRRAARPQLRRDPHGGEAQGARRSPS